VTLDEAITELRALDPYSACPITDAQEEAARTLIAAVERVRDFLAQNGVQLMPGTEEIVTKAGVLRALDGEP